MILWKNGYFHTLIDEEDIYTSVLTHNGIIIDIGNDIKVPKDTTIYDLNGGHVYPGFVDTHLHLIGHGRKILTPNLNHSKDKSYILNSLTSFYKDKDLFVEGYFNVGITKDELDFISKDYYIILRHNDYHSFTVNSKVLNDLNIESTTGILIEDDSLKVLPIWSNYRKEYLEEMTEASIKDLHKHGITTVLTDDLAYFNSYLETKEIIESKTKNKLLRTHMLIHEDILDEYLKDDVSQSNLIFQSVKTFYDGTLSSKTALLNGTYKNTNTQGRRMHKKDEFVKLIKKVRNHHLSLSIHTIGDRALDEIVDLLSDYPPLDNTFDRIIHGSLANIDTIDKLSKMPVYLDLQPQFVSSDLPFIETLFTHHPLIYPFKTYENYNILYGFSSDAPVENPSVVEGIYAAVYRKSSENGQSYGLNEALTRFNALKKYTLDASKTLGYTNKGLIKKGYLADFSVLKKDILTISSNEFLNNDVLFTIINEHIVYKKDVE